MRYAGVGLAVLALMVVAWTPGAEGAGETLALTVTPSEIDRGEPFTITVLTSSVNASILVVLTDERGGSIRFENRTDNVSGAWTFDVRAALDFGRWSVEASWTNESGLVASAKRDFRIVCLGRCISDTLAENLDDFRSFLGGLGERLLILLLVVLALFEGPKTAAWLYAEGDRARREGTLTPREYVTAPFSGFRGFLAPSRQGIRAAANERIAVDTERRETMDELHRATRDAFREWNPRHHATLKRIFEDLDRVVERERHVVTTPPRIYKEYERPERKPKTSEETVMDELKDFEAERVERKRRTPSWRGAYLILGVGGGLGAVMAALVLLAYVGVYVEPLRAAWSPWPPDLVKVILGVGLAGGAAWGALAIRGRTRASA